MPAENPEGVGRELHRGLVSDYDTFVNWDVRLARELPFFRSVFADAGAQRVIDMGCGSARHAIEFACAGMKVDGVDPDEAMLASARVNAADAAEKIARNGGELALAHGEFGELAALGLRDADAITCTGNALPHVRGLEGLRLALVDFCDALKPSGALVLHLLNHDRLLKTRQRTLPPPVREVPEGTRVFLRVIDYPADGGEFLGMDFVTLVRDAAGEWTVASHRSPHTMLSRTTLERELGDAGFDRVEFFGAHDRHPLTDADESLIVLARRRA
jgi:SAM-dependent methyltransferase